jgi:acetyltransferase-like isoleucine patch superfamily enzyme
MIMHLPRERFEVYIHPSTIIPDDCEIGPFTTIGKNVRIGRNVTIKDHCRIDDGVFIGDNVQIRGSSVICENMVIAGDNDLGHALICTNHPNLTKYSKPEDDIKLPPTIGPRACIGARVTLMPGVVIGHDALIGAHCVVTKDVPSSEVWYAKGVAAKQND